MELSVRFPEPRLDIPPCGCLAIRSIGIHCCERVERHFPLLTTRSSDVS